MATGSPDYWATRENRMNTILTFIQDNMPDMSALVAVLDSMDGKMDGIVDLQKLSDNETGILARMFGIDTTDGSGLNLLTKLDALDGKIDGQMDLAKLELMSIFFDSGTSKPRLQAAVENLDGTIGTLKSSIDELITIAISNQSLLDEVESNIITPDWTEDSWSIPAGTATKILDTNLNRERAKIRVVTSWAYFGTSSSVSGTVYWFYIYGGNERWFKNYTGEIWAYVQSPYTSQGTITEISS